MTKAQLGVYYGSYQLVPAMISDAYVAGYMSNRVLGLAAIAANLVGGLGDGDLVPIVSVVYPSLFGPQDARELLRAVYGFAGNVRLKEEYVRGQTDAFAFHQYLTGQQDFTKHSRYADLRANDVRMNKLLGEKLAEFSTNNVILDTLVSFEQETFGQRLRDGGWQRQMSDQKPGWSR
jgi:hypothetical protein